MEEVPTMSKTMNPTDVLEHARETMTVRRVFGDPIERNGVTLVPVASIKGGAGGGGGEGNMKGKGEETDTGPGGTGSGSGGGFGVSAKPAGVYVIEGTRVRWQPAVDANRVIMGGQIVAAVFFIMLGLV